MFTGNKSMTCIATMAFGFCFFAACGDNDASTASTFSETDTGKPIAQLDTSLLNRQEKSWDGCVEVVEDENPVLARKAVPNEDGNVRTLIDDCTESSEILLYIDVKVRVVDSKGKPLSGAKAYRGECEEDDMSCQYTTDENGYFYMDSVNFLSYVENFVGSNHTDSVPITYSPLYESMQLRVVSADSSLGINTFAYFGEASFIFNDEGKPVAVLKNLVLEQVYSAKLYLDSIHVLENESINEFVEDGKFEICVAERNGILSEIYEEKGRPYDWYPCQMVKEEDLQNGFVTVYGLPEGVYDFCIGSANAKSCSGEDSLVVKR